MALASTPSPGLENLPENTLLLIAATTDLSTQRSLRLTCRTFRALVDLRATSLTLSDTNLPFLLPRLGRSRLPSLLPRLSHLHLQLLDLAPHPTIALLPSLGLSSCTSLTSLTLTLHADHTLTPASLPTLGACIPTSLHTLAINHHVRPAFGLPWNSHTPSCSSPNPSTPTLPVLPGAAGPGPPSPAPHPPAPSLLDLPSLAQLLQRCPHIAEVHLAGGCWAPSRAELQALAAMPQLVCIKDLQLGCADGWPQLLSSLPGLRALDLHLVAGGGSVGHAGAAAAGGGVGAGVLGEAAAAAGGADGLSHILLASEQLVRALSGSSLSGLTRLVVCEFQVGTAGVP